MPVESLSRIAHLQPRVPSQPFRRRGYERDGMLMTVIERGGHKEAFERSKAEAHQAMNSKPAELAIVPAEVRHFNNDALFDRPVQAELVSLLLLPKWDTRFKSCVVIHGKEERVFLVHVRLTCQTNQAWEARGRR